MTLSNLAQDDILALERYIGFLGGPADWTVETYLAEHCPGQLPRDLELQIETALYERGKELYQDGFKVAYSRKTPAWDTISTVLLPNGSPVPPERLVSQVAVVEAGFTATNQLYQGLAIYR